MGTETDGERNRGRNGGTEAVRRRDVWINGRNEGIEEGGINEQSLWNNTNFTLNRLQIMDNCVTSGAF